MNDLVRFEAHTPQTAVSIRAQVNLIQEVMQAVMREGTHYGKIPGTPKPSLWKPGAEVLAATFHIAPSYRIEDLSGPDFVRYRIACVGTHQGSGIVMGEGMGECSSLEEKYKWRKSVNAREFAATPEDRRRIKYGYDKNERREYEIQQVRTECADQANTILKMACKRAQVAMTLNVTAASDIFTQDIEDLPEELRPDEEAQKREPEKKTEPGPYPAERFAELLPAWRDLIASGKKTAEQIIAMLQSKHTLTVEQKAAIQGTNGAAAPAVITALRKKIEDATLTEAGILKHLGVASLDGITVAQVEKALAFVNNPMGEPA